ncbi:hypothetical protein JW899_02305 [Candidatus Uhrbacteria bacterium]|nr:hypothetical protein [Candidatus Uhrbacteria bacterium]
MDDRFFTFSTEELVREDLQGVFAAPSTRQRIGEVATRHRLLDHERQVLHEIVRDVFAGRLEDSDIAVELSKRTGLVLEKGFGVQADMYRDLFSEIDEALDDQRETYVDFHPEEFLPPDPGKRDAIRELAAGAVEESGFVPDSDRIRERLVGIVDSHVRDIRDGEETLASLMKPVKTGGMEMTEGQARAVLAAADAARQAKDERVRELEEERSRWQERVREAEERKRARMERMPLPSSESTVEPVRTAPEDILLADEGGDSEEIARIAGQAGRDGVDGEGDGKAPDGSDLLSDRVDRVVAKSGTDLPEGLDRRYRVLVEAYFRDLRDGMETRAKLVQPVGNGGLGLSPDAADRIMGFLNAELSAYRSAMTERVAGERSAFVSRRQEMIMNGDLERDRKESLDLDRRFSRLTGQAPARPEDSPQQEPDGVPAFSDTRLPLPKPVRTAGPAVIPVVGIKPSHEAIAVPKPPDNLPVLEADPEVAPVMMLPAPDGCGVERPKPKPPVRQPAVTTGDRKVVSDIRFTPKLTGPVEELRSICLADFRRLSKDPKEAAVRIKDKIDLLSDQSFEVRSEGVKSWQESEVNRLYLEILRESLEGKPVTLVIGDRERDSRPFLTKPEFDAVMELNRRLRFG